MDEKKIKEIVVECLWPKKFAKYGNDYRNLTGRIERFCKRIKVDDSLQQIFPVECLSDEEIAALCISFIRRDKKNKYILTKLKNKSSVYDYNELAIQENIDSKIEDGALEEEIEDKNLEKEIKDEDLLDEIEDETILSEFDKKLEDKLDYLLSEIEDSSYCFVYRRIPYADNRTTFIRILEDLEKWSIECIDRCSEFSDCMKMFAVKRNQLISVRIYIGCMCNIIYALLMHFISGDIGYKKEKLSQLECNLEEVYSKMDNYILELKQELGCREERYKALFKQLGFSEEKSKEQLKIVFQENADRIVSVFIEILYFNAKCNNTEKIWNWLKKEMTSDQQLFGKTPLIINVNENGNNKEWEKEFITEGVEVKKYEEKYKQIIKFINIIRGNTMKLNDFIDKIELELQELRSQKKFFDLLLKANRKPQVDHFKAVMKYTEVIKRDLEEAEQIFMRDRKEYTKIKQNIGYDDILRKQRKEIDDLCEKLNAMFELNEYKDDLEKEEDIDTISIKVYFREIFMSKVRCIDEGNGRKQRAQSIVREILAGNKVGSLQMKFLIEKINRGYYRELGLLEEYEYVKKILIVCENILLRCLYHEDEKKIFYELHKKFCDILELILIYSE